MATYNYIKIKEYQALGGPVKPAPERGATPTREGRYVIGSIKKHVSGGRWELSTIEWGTPLHIEKEVLQVKIAGSCRNISSLPGFQRFRGNEKLLIECISVIYDNYKAEPKLKLLPGEE